ncbi:helix-turn-helix transcriptional regulator [Sporosarcina sp. Te-1]|uniref:helix-turn-helix transcriptional regulator n=1 Tax=Sporosarcina sp. Te-1 TaxID=2818390 RepID=UPI001A9D8BC4|nr:helix-turn-helix transcriptional regulator [Sporosarcina sp. Te-1]QTD42032.1 helix-turn-helix transcriptional regulator [Sporosarcina sp. Te-1]
MNNQTVSYTTEEIADMLKVSKLTVYDLIKKGDLRAYRVGRQMRIDEEDLEAYKESSKSGQANRSNQQSEVLKVSASPSVTANRASPPPRSEYQLIISGQDISLDLLANAIEKGKSGYRPLRSYTGSLNSLVSMYRGEADLVSLHLFDGDTGTYNIPYVKRMLVGHSYMVVNLLFRTAGLYVQKGNPKGLSGWRDFKMPGLTIANREKGSGARVLLDEKLRMEGISAKSIPGYKTEELNHIAVAAKVAAGKADVGVGIEKAAQLTGVDFIPLIQEQYDIVLFKTEENVRLRESLQAILQSMSFRNELESLGGYDLSSMGRIIYETE